MACVGIWHCAKWHLVHSTRIFKPHSDPASQQNTEFLTEEATDIHLRNGKEDHPSNYSLPRPLI